MNVQVKIMGILNATPDSFSDTGLYFSPDKFAQKIWDLLDKKIHILDVGAQSTAPKNSGNALSREEEIKRLENLLLEFWRLSFKKIPTNLILSLDTFHVETFIWAYEELRKIDPQREIWFNDVSGCFDIELIRLLERNFQHFKYVLTHNRIPERNLTNHHMEFVKKKESSKDHLYQEIKTFFQQVQNSPYQKSFILDPGFGFAKSREENWWLWELLPQLMDEFSEFPWLIGISRKKFLRPVNDFSDDAVMNAEKLQAKMLKNLCHFHSQKQLIFRLHAPEILA